MYRHYRIRYRRRYSAGRGSALAIAAGAACVIFAHPGAAHAGHASHAHRPAESHAAQVAIAYAESKLGDPYVWAATGPDEFDCSGLVMAAYEHAGYRSFPRTSEDQYADLRHTSHPADGDLVFFVGGDGQPSPGHVALIVSARKHLMVEAYATGYPIRYSHYGLPSSPAGDEDPVGYAQP